MATRDSTAVFLGGGLHNRDYDPVIVYLLMKTANISAFVVLNAAA
jgi:hypothetical protein